MLITPSATYLDTVMKLPDYPLEGDLPYETLPYQNPEVVERILWGEVERPVRKVAAFIHPVDQGGLNVNTFFQVRVWKVLDEYFSKAYRDATNLATLAEVVDIPALHEQAALLQTRFKEPLDMMGQEGVDFGKLAIRISTAVALAELMRAEAKETLRERLARLEVDSEVALRHFADRVRERMGASASAAVGAGSSSGDGGRCSR